MCDPPSARRKTTTVIRRRALRLLAWLVPLLVAMSAPAADLTALAGPSAGETPVISAPTPLGALEYRVGRGLTFGNTGLHLGGFATLELDRAESEPGELLLEGVNFLVLYEPLPRLRVFSEIELGELFLIDLGGAPNRADPVVDVDRLWAELRISDELAVKVGQFLTPIGRWNQVPAEAFVWTTSEPVIVDFGFEDLTTGAQVSGAVFEGDHELAWRLYGRFADAFEINRDEKDADHSIGARAQLGSALGDWSFGLSAAGFDRGGRWDSLVGTDAVVRYGPFELTFEAEATFGRRLLAELEPRGDEGEDDGEDEAAASADPARGRVEADLWGAYVQGVYEIVPTLYAVARYEHVDFAGPDHAVDLGDLGLAWTPLPYLFLKADYRFVDRPTDDIRRGVHASISVLF